MHRITFTLIVGLILNLPLAPARAANAPADSGESPQVQTLRNAVRALGWVKGPTEVQVGTNATLKIPDGYRFLDVAETAKFSELMRNPSGGKSVLVAPGDLHWFALLQFVDTGYVKDNDTLDADAILKSISDGTEAANAERRKRGWPEMHVVGWRIKPAYDQETKHLEWAIDGKSDAGVATNFFTKILGRHGVTSAVLVTDPSELSAAVPEFKRTIAGYGFKPGETYAEFRPGDKVAEYGLAGLIAGGAVAVAAKTGLLKGLWKFLLAGGVAGLAALRKWFGGKTKNA